MKGQLQDMAVADIIQLNCQDRRTARVSIKNGGKKVDLFFKNGNMVHASYGDQEGEEAVYQVITWEKGSFVLKNNIEPPAFTITRGWTSLLLEGARRQDEAQVESLFDGSAPEQSSQNNANGSDAQHLLTRQNVTQNLQSLGDLVTTDEDNDDKSPEDLLRGLADQVEGFISATLATPMGEDLYSYSIWDIDVSAILDQVCRFVKMVDTAVAKLGAGALEDNLLTTEDAYILVRFLKNKDYFLLVVVDKVKANLGNLSMLSRNYSIKMHDSLAQVEN